MSHNSDSRLILLHDSDSVFVCGKSINAGEAINMEGDSVTPVIGVETGHKIARRYIKAGEKVLKYGVSIGSATCNVQRGEHIHMHNMKSDYISSTPSR